MGRDLLHYVAISAGMALAASCYTMLGGLLGIVDGPWVVLAVVLAGTFCVLVSTSVGELAAMFPSAPGIRTYLRAAFGNHFSLAVLFLYLAMVALAAGVEGTVVAGALAGAFPALPADAVVPGLFVLVVALNILGLEAPRTFQLVVTATLLAATLWVGVSAFAPDAPIAHPRQFATAGLPSVVDLAAAVGAATFLFMGFEWVTPLGRNPAAYRRLIPLSMIVAIAVLALIYGVFAAALDARLDHRLVAADPTPQITLGVLLFGEKGRYAMAAVCLMAMLTSFNAGLMGASRLAYGLAREGLLPAWVARIDLRTGVPFNAVASIGCLSCVLTMVVMTTGAYRLAGLAVAAIVCLVYAALMGAVLRLRRCRPDAARSFRNPLPRPAQWLVAACLPLLALSALLSLPQAGWGPLLLVTFLAAGAALAAALAIRRKDNRLPLARKQGVAP